MQKEYKEEKDSKKIKKENTYIVQRKQATIFENPPEPPPNIQSDDIYETIYDIQISDSHTVELAEHLYIEDLKTFKLKTQDLLKSLLTDLLNDYNFVEETDYVEQIKKILEL